MRATESRTFPRDCPKSFAGKGKFCPARYLHRDLVLSTDLTRGRFDVRIREGVARGTIQRNRSPRHPSVTPEVAGGFLCWAIDKWPASRLRDYHRGDQDGSRVFTATPRLNAGAGEA